MFVSIRPVSTRGGLAAHVGDNDDAAPPVTLGFMLGLPGLRTPLPLPRRGSDDALDVRARLRRRRLEGVRERRGGGPLRSGLRPRGPGRARAARAVARDVPAAACGGRCAGGGGSRRARPGGEARADDLGVHELARARTSARRLPREPGRPPQARRARPGCSPASPSSAAGSSAPPRSRSAGAIRRSGTPPPRSALTAATRAGAQAGAEDRHAAGLAGRSPRRSGSAKASARRPQRRSRPRRRRRRKSAKRPPCRAETAPPISSGAGTLTAAATRIAGELKTLDDVSHDDADGAARSRLHREPDGVSRRQLTRLQGDAGDLGNSVASFEATLRKLGRDARALKSPD